MCINITFDFISEPTLRLKILILNDAKIHIVNIRIIFIIVIILLKVADQFTFSLTSMILKQKIHLCKLSYYF